MEMEGEPSSKEIIIRLTELDTILPSQYYGPRHRQAPEQGLMIAILNDAVECVKKYRFAMDRYGQRLFQEAKQWLLADETRDIGSIPPVRGNLGTIGIRGQ